MQSADRIEFLVHTYADRITRIGYTWFGNVHDAQDVCQTVLLRLMTHDCPDDSPEAERAWVLRVTINVCKDIKRSAWFRRTVGLDEGAARTGRRYRAARCAESAAQISKGDLSALL